MYWQESEDQNRFAVPDDVVDLAFNMSCRCLPVDHAYPLSQAIVNALPWFAEEAGLHPIHVADSGNGWMRPQDPSALLYPSRRTKLMLRVPKQRVADAEALCGTTLRFGGSSLSLEKAVVRPLSAITTVLSHYIVAQAGHDETAFLQDMVTQLQAMTIRPKKMLCGKETVINTPEGIIRARSVMLADLTLDESIRLQQRGLGPLRHLGCGLFIGHKDINEVKQTLD